jgi:serine/threonine protein kinase
MAEHSASDDLDTSATTSESLKGGTRLGRYELLLPVATGGMARVWAARQHGQRGFSKLVAIKTILPHLAREPEFERMFLDEAKIASLVHHPNVCEIYELGEEGRVLYLAMEWVSGDSLMHVLRLYGPKGEARVEAIDLRVAARIVADGCAGLHAAHELLDEDNNPMNVVHRDVSPHNLLLTAEGHVKVADFGVAKALGQTHQATVAGQIKGKLAYMAPEQVTGAPIDRRSDVFSAGCILYEATTGQLPFKGEGDHQIMHSLLKGEYALPSKILQGFPRDLEKIIVKAISPSPGDRFNTAREMKVGIDEWLVSSGPAVTPPHVALVVRERIGSVLEKRREKIRVASHVHQSVSGSGAIISLPGGTPSQPHAIQPSASGVLSKAGDYSNAGRVMPPVADLGIPILGAAYPVSGAERSSAPTPESNPGEMAPASNVMSMSVQMQTNPGYAPDETPPASIGKYLLAMAIGIGIALLVGLLAITAIHTARKYLWPEPPEPAPASAEPMKAAEPPKPKDTKVEPKPEPPKPRPEPPLRPRNLGPTRLP